LRISGTNLLHQQSTETATYTDASGRTCASPIRRARQPCASCWSTSYDSRLIHARAACGMVRPMTQESYKPYKRCMVMGGGGFRFGIYIGMYAALRQAGKAPDVLLASCGGAIAAAIIHNLPDPKRSAHGYRPRDVRILVQPALHR
jgi:hypothetical protein